MDFFSIPTEFMRKSYKEVQELCLNCQRCVLHETRTKVVFGSGPVPCDIMLIGEGPGEDEDLSGLPFVGKAGQLLSKILESANILREKDIFIANTVKCRPPNNRQPHPTEIEACANYLAAQINLVKPKIIILAGTPSMKTILGSLLTPEDTITKVRGRWFKIKAPYAEEEIYLMPIFHPAYLLRNASRDEGSPKWLTWQDMKEVRGALDYHRSLSK